MAWLHHAQCCWRWHVRPFHQTINDTETYDLNASASTGAVTLIGNNQDGQTLTAGSDTDSLIVGNGAGDTLTDGVGVDTLTGGTSGDIFDIFNGTAGSTVTSHSLRGTPAVMPASSRNQPLTHC
jgi:hypothetical protein